MWVKISDKTKINKGDKILRYPSYGETSTEQPTGQEENSELYEVDSKSFDGVTLRWLVNGTIDGMKLGNMTRQVNFSDLESGEWWYNGGGE
jgi:hypothetical protein